MDLKVKVNQASPHELVRLMFDGALDNLANAKAAIEAGDDEGQNNHLKAALAIIDGLKGSLDAKRGGSLAENLFALYSYMNRRLIEADDLNSVDPLVEVSDLILTLKEAWEAIEPECMINQQQCLA